MSTNDKITALAERHAYDVEDGTYTFKTEHLEKFVASLHAAQPAACTCPTGDGSLRWPCPQHPPAQAEPVGHISAKELEEFGNLSSLVSGRAVMLHKDAKDSRIPLYTCPAPSAASSDARCRGLLKEALAVLTTWRDVVPAVTLRTDIDAALSAPASSSDARDAARDAARLDFMAQHEAWIAWSKDGDSCRVFRGEKGGAA